MVTHPPRAEEVTATHLLLEEVVVAVTHLPRVEGEVVIRMILELHSLVQLILYPCLDEIPLDKLLIDCDILGRDTSN